MSHLSLSNVNLNAVAETEYDNHHIFRHLTYADGHQKVLGCLLPATHVDEYELIYEHGPHRIEITAGECDVRFENAEDYEYYRAGQSFVVSAGKKFYIKNQEMVQYIRHFEG